MPTEDTGPPAAPPTDPPADRSSGFPDIPGRPVLIGLAVLVVLGGNLGAHYLSDPASIPRPWRGVAGWTAGFVVFFAASTLTQIVAVFATPVRLPSTRRFLEFVGTYSAIGAIAGAALGVRGAMHLFVGEGRDSGRYGLPDFLSTMSDDITLVTLIMLALCWPFAIKLFREMASAIRERSTHQGVRIPGATSHLVSFVILAYGNWTGLNAAFFAYELLNRYP
ncbi:hypothetical protein [Micromonospora sp. NPDC023888]|uniref:hypothetical protein n=1 Tax=Micromonospora sp. NPDC023888 TaxID=3155607 RepID=UPI0033E39A8A